MSSVVHHDLSSVAPEVHNFDPDCVHSSLQCYEAFAQPIPLTASSTASTSVVVRHVHVCGRQHLWLACNDGTVQIRRPSDGALLRTIPDQPIENHGGDEQSSSSGHARLLVSALAVVESQTSECLVWTSSADGVLRCWTPAGRLIRSCESAFSRGVVALACCAGALWSAHSDASLLRRDRLTGQVVARLTDGFVSSVRCIVGVGSCVWLAGAGGVRVLDSSQGRIVARLSGHAIGSQVLCMIVERGAASSCVWTGGSDGTVCMWDAETWTLRRKLRTTHREVAALCLVGKDDVWATSNNDQVVEVRDSLTGDLKLTMPASSIGRHESQQQQRERIQKGGGRFLQLSERRTVSLACAPIDARIHDGHVANVWMCFRNPVSLEAFAVRLLDDDHHQSQHNSYASIQQSPIVRAQHESLFFDDQDQDSSLIQDQSNSSSSGRKTRTPKRTKRALFGHDSSRPNASPRNLSTSYAELHSPQPQRSQSAARIQSATKRRKPQKATPNSSKQAPSQQERVLLELHQLKMETASLSRRLASPKRPAQQHPPRTPTSAVKTKSRVGGVSSPSRKQAPILDVSMSSQASIAAEADRLLALKGALDEQECVLDGKLAALDSSALLIDNKLRTLATEKERAQSEVLEDKLQLQQHKHTLEQQRSQLATEAQLLGSKRESLATQDRRLAERAHKTTQKNRRLQLAHQDLAAQVKALKQRCTEMDAKLDRERQRNQHYQQATKKEQKRREQLAVEMSELRQSCEKRVKAAENERQKLDARLRCVADKRASQAKQDQEERCAQLTKQLEAATQRAEDLQRRLHTQTELRGRAAEQRADARWQARLEESQSAREQLLKERDEARERIAVLQMQNGDDDGADGVSSMAAERRRSEEKLAQMSSQLAGLRVQIRDLKVAAANSQGADDVCDMLEDLRDKHESVQQHNELLLDENARLKRRLASPRANLVATPTSTQSSPDMESLIASNRRLRQQFTQLQQSHERLVAQSDDLANHNDTLQRKLETLTMHDVDNFDEDDDDDDDEYRNERIDAFSD